MGELTELIQAKLIAFDSAPLIYYIEEHTAYLPIVDELFTAFDNNIAQGMTSVLTLQEVLVKPLRTRKPPSPLNTSQYLLIHGTSVFAALIRQLANKRHTFGQSTIGCERLTLCKSPRQSKIEHN